MTNGLPYYRHPGEKSGGALLGRSLIVMVDPAGHSCPRGDIPDTMDFFARPPIVT